MDDRTVLRLGLFASFALIAGFAVGIGIDCPTPIRVAPVLLGMAGLIFIRFTHERTGHVA